MTVSQLTLEDLLEDLLRPLREESLRIAKTGRYGEGAVKIRRWLEAHPGWQAPLMIIQGTHQLNYTARISEYNRYRLPGEPPILWNGAPRDSMYRLKEER